MISNFLKSFKKYFILVFNNSLIRTGQLGTLPMVTLLGNGGERM